MANKRILPMIALAAVLTALPGCGRDEPPTPPAKNKAASPATEPAETYTGSATCKDCHEVFYEKWATSHHGLAMQPYTSEFAESQLEPHSSPLTIGKTQYQADIKAGLVREDGPEGEKTYPIQHAMGGKNVFYFLTPRQRGRLQVLPLAFDARKREWYDTAGSMLRHFADEPDEAIDWREPQLTFNRSCYSCHVSQLEKNYDIDTDTYHTTWAEPGINCETCHGPAAAHLQAMENNDEELRIIVNGDFTPEQTDGICGPCHAKAYNLVPSFIPGDRFFDHYNMTTLEDRDFYPDGRDLGENFTFTLWRISPCVTKGNLDCTHCHTSSGRDRHAENPDQACMPCHEQHVTNPAAHSHHEADSEGSRCVTCHMPRTVFARMQRHDHTMLPPTPGATIAFKSPNACNICHEDHDAAWSDEWVRKWYPRDYQAPLLHRAGLIDAARKRDWKKLPGMLAYLQSDDRNEVFAASLIRLLESCESETKWPALIEALDDPSPLVRSSAATALGYSRDPKVRDALLAVVDDEYRLVRIQTAYALSHFPGEPTTEQKRATDEYMTSILARPDDPGSYYNLGNYYFNRSQNERAVNAFETSLRLQPDYLLSLVNVALAYARQNEPHKAERTLRKAIEIDPDSSPANFNLGLLMSETGRMAEAEKALRAAFKADPLFAAAAYNLGVLLAQDRRDEAITWCRKAVDLDPENPKYRYTLAFFSHEDGDVDTAIDLLTQTIENSPQYLDAHILLGTIHERREKWDEALAVYLKALKVPNLSQRDYEYLAGRVTAIDTR